MRGHLTRILNVDFKNNFFRALNLKFLKDILLEPKPGFLKGHFVEGLNLDLKGNFFRAMNVIFKRTFHCSRERGFQNDILLEP